MRTEELFVRWTPDLQEAVHRLVEREGVSRSARLLDMPERNLHDLRRGLSRGGGEVRTRKFIAVDTLARIARALDELELEDRDALPRRDWSERGEWRTVPARTVAA